MHILTENPTPEIKTVSLKVSKLFCIENDHMHDIFYLIFHPKLISLIFEWKRTFSHLSWFLSAQAGSRQEWWITDNVKQRKSTAFYFYDVCT